MVERATLKLDSGEEVRVEVERDDLDGDEIVVRRIGAADRPGPEEPARRRRRGSRECQAASRWDDRSAACSRSGPSLLKAGLYVDTSALGRVVLDEPDASAIRKTLASYDDWWSSELLLVELRRLGLREDVEDLAELLIAGVHFQLIDRESLVVPSVVRKSCVESARGSSSVARTQDARRASGT